MYYHYTFTSVQAISLDWSLPLLAQTLADWGFESFEEMPEAGILHAYISEDAHLKSSQLSEQLPTDKGLLSLYDIVWQYQIESIPSSDWLATWRASTFEPISLRGQILVTTPDLAPTHPTHPIQLLIEAHNAFGSGEHHTTRMILESLLDHHIKGAQVIDMGCGTGILGIATLLLGARSLVAIDISSECVANSLHNLQLNGLSPSEHISIQHGDALSLSTYPSYADLLIANIHRNIILQDLPSYVMSTRVGGEVWLSGFLRSDSSAIQDAIQRAGLRCIQERCSDEWLFIRCRKE